jgi:hypothetical protein
MTRTILTHRQSAERLLADELHAADGVAAAAVRLFERMALHLSPLIGVSGVDVLFARSLKLAKLVPPGPVLGSVAVALEPTVDRVAGQLRAALEAEPPEVALPRAAELFAHFFSLLAVFIGERLTAELIEGAPPLLPGVNQRMR